MRNNLPLIGREAQGDDDARPRTETEAKARRAHGGANWHATRERQRSAAWQIAEEKLRQA